MIDIAELGLSVRSDGVVVATKSLDKLEKASKRAETAQERLAKQADKVGKSMRNIGRSMQLAGARMSLVFTAPIVAAGFAAVRLAVDAEETANKFDVVFRGSVERATAALEELTNTVPLTLTEMRALSAQTQDMLVPMGLARDVAADLSVEAVKLAGDLASFNNVPVAEVLANIGSALAGQSEPLRKYGIDVRKTRLESIALAEGLIQVGDEMTNAATAQATFIAITRDSSDAMGDAARTVNSTANEARFLARDFKQLQEDVGRDLIPVYKELLQLLQSGLTWFKQLTPEQRKMAIQIAAITAATGPLVLVLGSLVRVLGTLLPLLVRLGALLGPASVIAIGVGVLVKLIGEQYVAAIEKGITSTTRYIGSLRELSEAADMAGLKSNLQSVNETIISLARQQAELQGQIGAITRGRNDTGIIEIPGLRQMQEDLEQLERELGNLRRLRGEIESEITKLTKARVNPEVLRELKAGFEFLDSLGGAGDTLDEKAFQKLFATLDPAAVAMRELAEARVLLNAARGKLGEEEFERLAKLLERSDLAFKAFADRIGSKKVVNPQVLADFERWSNWLDEINEEQEEFNRRLQELRDIGDPVAAMVRTLTNQMQDLDRAVREGAISERERQIILNVLTHELGQAAAATLDLTEETDHLREAALEATRQMTQAFLGMWQDILNGGENAFDGLLSGLRSTLAQINHDLSTAKIGEELNNALDDVDGNFDFKNLAAGIGASISLAVGAELGGGGQGASMGAAIGGAIGSIWGPIGQAIGALLGGLAGGLFDRDLEFTLGGENERTRPDNQTITTALGDVVGIHGQGGFGDLNDPSTFGGQIAQALTAFDQSIFELFDSVEIDPEVFAGVTDALDNWVASFGENATAADVLQSRFNVILGEFNSDIQNFVNTADNFEDQIKRFDVALRAQRLFDEMPELFEGRELNEFLAVIGAVAHGTTDLSEAFGIVLEQLQKVAAAKQLLQNFVDSDFIADYERMVMLQNETPVDTLSRLSSDLFDAVANFDRTPDQLVEIAGAFGTIREAGVNAIAHIDAAWKGLTATIDRLRQDTLDIIAGPKSERDIFVDAAGLVDQAKQAQTPEELSRLVAQFDSLIRQLTPETAQRLGGDLIDLIDRFQGASDASFDRIRDQTLDAIASVQTMADAFLTSIPDALALVASTNERAAMALEAIAGVEGSASSIPGVSSPVDTAAITNVLGASSANQEQILATGTTMMADALRSGTANLQQNIASAIQSGFGSARIVVNVQIADNGLATQ